MGEATPLAGELVVLRPVAREDIDALCRIFAEPAVSPWWCHYDRARIEKEMLGDDDPGTTVYAVQVGQDVAGIIQSWEETEPEYRQAGIDIALGTAWHGCGVAVDAIRTLARDLIGRQGHHHLTIDPAADNARAIACYTKLGFQPVGVLRPPAERAGRRRHLPRHPPDGPAGRRAAVSALTTRAVTTTS